MKLKQGDKIRSEDTAYEVIAVVLTTVYLRAIILCKKYMKITEILNL